MVPLSRDTDGNLNIDFLVGVVLFIGAFLFLINTIPGIFLPYQTDSVDLGSVVYRTSCLLAEDPGWWSDGILNGVNWEQYVSDPDKISRVGLAIDKKMPNVLSQDKIRGMSALAYNKTREELGLNNTMTYNYSLVITQFLPDGTTKELLDIDQPNYNNNVESIDRMILIRQGEGLYYNGNTHGEFVLPLKREPYFDLGNITIRLDDCVPSVPPGGVYSGFLVSYIVGAANDSSPTSGQWIQASQGSEYYIYKNDLYKDAADLEVEPFDVGDKIEIVVDVKAIYSKYSGTDGINISNILLSTFFINGQRLEPFPSVGEGMNYEEYNLTNPNYRYFDTRGTMKLQVWQV